MKKLFFGVAIFSLFFSSLEANASLENLSLCNNCEPSTNRVMAIAASNSMNGVAHVVDVQNGIVNSYYVEHSNEPGFSYSFATQTATPSDLTQAVQQVHYYVSERVSNGARFDTAANVLTENVRIPSSIATTASSLNIYENSQAVSNYLRLMLVPNIGYQFQASWRAVVLKMKIVVNVVFEDGSSAVYKMGPIFFSDHPYILVEGSITGPNGNPLQSSSGVEVVGTRSWNDTSGGTTILCECELWRFPDGNGGFYVIPRNCTYKTIRH